MSGSDFASRLAAVRSAIDEVPRRWTHPVRIVAVTKGFGPDVLERAVDGGCEAVGENYAQELLAKRHVLDRCPADRRPEVPSRRSCPRRHRLRQPVGRCRSQ